MADAEKSTTAAPPPLPSIGSYKLLESLGSGGMSSVFKAIHSETGHVVAVKILPRSLAKNPTLLQRFLREAKSAEALEHPNIVAIYDRGSEGGRYYLVLEYVAGGDLHDHVRSKGPMSIRDAVGVIREVSQGLAHAAGRGLIHRDIKPANLLLDPQGHVKITDLGLALQIADEDERVTRDGTTVGTVDYMSPDQARDSRGTSARSDIYSLGCTFYFLLTGAPPFAGGDLPDKLRRHAQEPPPDIRVGRPDVPEALARLIQKMMAKKPEGRFKDYEHLIAALDAIPLDGGAATAPVIPTALLDDEDDADSDDALVLTVADSAPATLPSSDKSSTSSPSRSAVPSAPFPEEPSLAELAALDDDVPVSPRKRPRSVAAAVPSPAFTDDSLAIAGARPTGTRYVEDTSVKDYILKGLMCGVAIVLVGFVLQQAVSYLRNAPEEAVEEVVEEQGGAEPEPFEPAIPPLQSPLLRKPPKTTAPPTKNELVAPVPVWREPEEFRVEIPPEPQFSGDLLRYALPAWASAKSGPTTGAATVLRRIEPGKGSAGRVSIARAFERPETIIELADNGPFYERDIRFGGSPRILRARSGFRPIVVLEPALTAHIKEQVAPFVLNGNDLTIEGVDLVVLGGPGDLPANQSALFAIRAGTLTLRDCTITVVGTQATTMSLVSMAESPIRNESKPPRVLIDHCLIRGPALSLVHLGEGRVEFVASRSVALCGDAPALSIAAQGKGPRRVDLSRSVIATRRAFLEDSSKTTAAPTVLKLLGNTIARIDGGPSGTLIQQAGSTEPAKQMEWIGDHNSFTGWSPFLTSGANRAVKLASLDDLRRSFPESARQSRVSPAPWPTTIGGEWTTPASLEPLAPEAVATLRAVASGNRFLLERSVGAFPKLLVPETVALPKPPAPPPLGVVKPVPVPKVHIYTETKITAQPAPKAATPKGEPNGPLDLTFHLADPAHGGDLGRFLAEQVRADGKAKHVRVVVDGQGIYPCTPFQVPPGVLLEIFVRSPQGTNPPTWRALAGASGDALISARGADLTILGARFERDGGSSLESLIHIEDGLLTLADCWLIAPGTVSEEGGTLVKIDSIGSKPLTPREPDAPTIPVTRLTDCLLLTGGKAIEAELGLGVVALSNCAIASGSDALTLIPAKVARFRLAADLWLDRCTVVGNRSIVRLGPWQGKEPGPDRPWLVSSRDCAFLDPFDRGATPRQAAVLSDDPNGLSRGTLVWQSANDAFDVGHFIVMADGPLPVVNKPDVQREWVAFWGRSHVGRVFGPLRNAPNAPHVRLLNGALTPGSVVPSDLVIDAKYAQAHKTAGIGADVNRLGIAVPGSASTVPRQPR